MHDYILGGSKYTKAAGLFMKKTLREYVPSNHLEYISDTVQQIYHAFLMGIFGYWASIAACTSQNKQRDYCTFVTGSNRWCFYFHAVNSTVPIQSPAHFEYRQNPVGARFLL